MEGRCTKCYGELNTGLTCLSCGYNPQYETINYDPIAPASDEGVRERVAEVVYKYLDLKESAQHPDDLISKIIALLPDSNKWVRVMDRLGEENCDLRCVNVPTGGDDYITMWLVIEHYEQEPKEREIGRGKSALEALEDAFPQPPEQKDKQDWKDRCTYIPPYNG